MRWFAVLLVSIGVLGAFGPARSAASAAPRAWVLYASDWEGPMEIFAADPSGKSSVRQVTFGGPPGGCYWAAACGFSDPIPSPDGRRLAFWSAGLTFQPRTLWLSSIDGSGRREIATATAAEWTDSKRLVYWAADGVHEVTVGGADRQVTPPPGRTLIRASEARGQGVLGTAWSADGRTGAYATQAGVFLVPAKGGRPRLLYAFAPADLSPVPPRPFELVFSPNGHLLAVTLASALAILDVRMHTAKIVPGSAHDLGWSPNGGQLLYVQRSDSSDGDSISTGDVRTVTPNGHVSVIVSRSARYGGQIVAAAWVVPPRGVSFRPPAPVDGVFAGGPVQKLAADGDRIAFASCGGVSVWNTPTGTTTAVQATGSCQAPFSRAGHVGTLALADDRVLWWSAYTGLGFRWSIDEATLGTPPIEVASGDGNLGSTPFEGTGTAVGAGSVLVMSSWSLHGGAVEQQTIERVDPGGCPCTAISSSPGPYTPLDVDQGRIVVGGTNETRILAADGTILLAIPVSTLAAQLSGSQLVIAIGSQLRVYTTNGGNLSATWPLPASPAGHDCDLFGDPSCNYGSALTPVTLEDVSHGLAAYTYNGQLHLLRLGDGADRVVAEGTLARFTDAGLVYVDGARIRLTASSQLPLQ